jgi:myo-inositol-1(or 4)-monophosphatase
MDAISKTATADVSTRLDACSDRAIKGYLRSTLSDPIIVSEEDGYGALSSTKSDELWLIDPLDGSHNASMGVPVVGVALAWARGGTIEGAAVVDVFGESSLTGSGDELRMRGPLTVNPPTRQRVVALQQAYSTPRASVALASVRDHLEARYARVLYTWCPVIDLLLTARGHALGWIAIGLGGPEYEAIRFLAQCIGLTCHQLDDGASEIGAAHTFVVAWPQHLDELVDVASIGMRGDLA